MDDNLAQEKLKVWQTIYDLLGGWEFSERTSAKNFYVRLDPRRLSFAILRHFSQIVEITQSESGLYSLEIAKYARETDH